MISFLQCIIFEPISYSEFILVNFIIVQINIQTQNILVYPKFILDP